MWGLRERLFQAFLSPSFSQSLTFLGLEPQPSDTGLVRSVAAMSNLPLSSLVRTPVLGVRATSNPG